MLFGAIRAQLMCRSARRRPPRSSRRFGGPQRIERLQHPHPLDIFVDIALAQMRIRSAEHTLVVARQSNQCTCRAPNCTIRNHYYVSPLRKRETSASRHRRASTNVTQPRTGWRELERKTLCSGNAGKTIIDREGARVGTDGARPNRYPYRRSKDRHFRASIVKEGGKYRLTAQRLREQADRQHDRAIRAQYRKIADRYDELAEQVEAAARRAD